VNGWTVLLVGAGAAVGAPLRYLADTAAKARFASVWPWGTFVVNVVGSLVLGAMTAGSAEFGPEVVAVVGTGFCGALTTYSTFGYEVAGLAERGRAGAAWGYLAASVAVGVCAAAIGFLVVRVLLG
jgi:CrcB protein